MLKNTPAFFSGKDSKPKFKANRNVYFRVTFHPSHLNKEIKEAWHSIVAFPPEEEPLNNLQTEAGFKIPVNGFVMCYVPQSTQLGQSVILHKNWQKTGAKMSSYLHGVLRHL